MNVIHHARRVIAMETHALTEMSRRLGPDFERAVQIICSSPGRLIVMGMGKSGHIGRKIAATMASTGTSSFFVHPGEAFHGDLGMTLAEDVILLISNSGETDELIRLLPFFRQQGNAIIAMTGKRNSTLGQGAQVVLDIGVDSEACSNNLAPTSSTTATLVMGDALAVTLSSLKGFKPEDFARFHPGGSLGRRLLSRVDDVMQQDHIPFCTQEASFRDVVQAISRGRLGLVLVGSHRHLHGVITDGDLRRTFEEHENPLALRARDMMSPQPVTIAAGARLADAELLMHERRISALVVLGNKSQVAGVVQLLSATTAISSIASPSSQPVAPSQAVALVVGGTVFDSTCSA